MKRAMLACLMLAMAGVVLAQDAKTALVGVWILRQEGAEVVARFGADGRFTRTEKTADGEEMASGRYVFDGRTLTLAPDGGEAVRITCRLVDADTLELVADDGSRARLSRQPTAAAPQAAPGAAAPEEQPHGQIAPRLDIFRPAASGHILFTRYAKVDAPLPGAPDNAAWLGRIHLMDGEGAGQGLFIGFGGEEYCHPAWAPDGSAVLFASSYESRRSCFLMDIFRADLRTGQTTRLTGAEWSAGPVKGFGRLAVVVDTGTAGIDDFFGLSDPRNQIKITYNGANGQVFRVTQNLQDKQGNDVRYRWVAFIDRVPAGQIWVRAWYNKHIGGVEPNVVVTEGQTTSVQIDMTSGNLLAHYPSVSPDGRYLVFRQGIAYYRRPAANAFGSDKIAEDGYDTMAVIDLQSPLRTLLAQWDATRMGGKGVDPRLSPDGRTIAFTYGLTPTDSIAVCSLESLVANQPQARAVAQGGRQLGNTLGHLHAAWSPDGRRLAFCRYMQVTEAWGTLFGGNLFVCNADGSGLTQVTQAPANQFPIWPTWSPDGRRIAFALLTSKGQRFEMLDLLPGRARSDIWTIGVDGFNPCQLTNDGLSCEPAWGK